MQCKCVAAGFRLFSPLPQERIRVRSHLHTHTHTPMCSKNICTCSTSAQQMRACVCNPLPFGGALREHALVRGRERARLRRHIGRRPCPRWLAFFRVTSALERALPFVCTRARASASRMRTIRTAESRRGAHTHTLNRTRRSLS